MHATRIEGTQAFPWRHRSSKNVMEEANHMELQGSRPATASPVSLWSEAPSPSICHCHLQWSELPHQAGKRQSVDFSRPSIFFLGFVSMWEYAVPFRRSVAVSKIWVSMSPRLRPWILELPPPQGRGNRKEGWWSSWRKYGLGNEFPSSHSPTAPVCLQKKKKWHYHLPQCAVSLLDGKVTLPCQDPASHYIWSTRWPSSSAVTESCASWQHKHYKFYYYIWNFMICLTTELRDSAQNTALLPRATEAAKGSWGV